jgi:hypothetical protein
LRRSSAEVKEGPLSEGVLGARASRKPLLTENGGKIKDAKTMIGYFL